LRKIGIVIIALIIFFPISPVFAQQISIGEPAKQTVEIIIGENEKVHVKHIIERSNTVQQVNFIEGTISNQKVIDVKGNAVESGTIGAETAGIVIFPTKEDVIVEYDMEDVLEFNEGVWKWNFSYLATTVFVFPDSIDLVFVNSRPVPFDENRAIRCHGCNATFEYIKNESIEFQEVRWEDKKFQVGIKTLAGITSFSFDQPTKKISFEVNENNKFITLIIPLELLWNPYEVFINDAKILKHEFFSNETHTWLNIRPETSGAVRIIGTSVVPEFPIFAPLLVGIAAVIILQFRNRLNLH